MDSTVVLALGAGALAVLWAIVLTVLVMRKAPGNARMIEIAGAIQEGASAYLNRQYIVIAGIGAAIAIVIFFLLNWQTAVLYVLGAALSAAAGYVGMNVAVRANLRTAEAARSGFDGCQGGPQVMGHRIQERGLQLVRLAQHLGRGRLALQIRALREPPPAASRPR